MKAWVVLPVAMAMCLAGFVVVVAGPRPSTCGSSWRVMSWNVKHASDTAASVGLADHADDFAWSRRGPVVAQHIADAAPDLVGLQEVGGVINSTERQITVLRENLPGYEWVGSRSSSPIGYRASAFTVVDQGRIVLGTADEPGTTWDRFAMWARLQVVGDGSQLLVVNVHAEHTASSAESRSLGWQRLVDALATVNPTKVPTVLVGDFNARADETRPVYQDHLTMLAAAGFSDAAVVAGDSGPITNVSTYNGWGAKVKGQWVYKAVARTGTRIDYVWTSGLQATSWQVDVGSVSWQRIRGVNTPVADQLSSDHWPVLATVGVGGGEGNSQLVLMSDGTRVCQSANDAAANMGDLPGSTVGEKVVNAALAYQGLPYSWGGGRLSGPSYGFCCSPGGNNGAEHLGFDCSGLVLYAWGRAGVRLPHSADAQAKSSGGQVIPRDLNVMRPGDVIGFSYKPGGHIFHVGIYMGGGRMIDSDSSGVGVDSVTSGYYAKLSWRVVRFG